MKMFMCCLLPLVSFQLMVVVILLLIILAHIHIAPTPGQVPDHLILKQDRGVESSVREVGNVNTKALEV